MKTLFAALLLSVSLQTHALEGYVCKTDKLEMVIKVDDIEGTKLAAWTVALIADGNTRVEGAGAWQKEEGSDDAFSAYDDLTAISYKNKKAVFVAGAGLDNAIVFPVCTVETLDNR